MRIHFSRLNRRANSSTRLLFTLTALSVSLSLAPFAQAADVPPALHNNDGQRLTLPKTLRYQFYQQLAIAENGDLIVAGKAVSLDIG